MSPVPHWLVMGRVDLSLLLAAGFASGCAPERPDPPSVDDEPEATDGSDTSASTETGAIADSSSGEPTDPEPWLCPAEPAPAPAFVLGWDYKDGWSDLHPGGPVTITIGGQGAWMIPLGVRGDGFCVPADPSAYDLVPTLDIRIEADGQPEPIALVLGFPVSFDPRDEGGFGYTFIPMILADDLDVDALEGVPTTIVAELRPRDTPPLSFTLAGVLTISD
jgi:hypothetical protein